MSRRAEGTSQVVSNGVALLLAYVLPRIFTLASVVLAARWLGTSVFGAYGTAAAFAVIAAVLATFGMQPLLVREIARAPEDVGRLIRAAHLLKAGSCVLMMAAVVPASFALFPDAPDVRRATWVLSLGWALSAYAENLAAYYQAVERMARWTQASALFGFVSAMVGVLLLVTTSSFVLYCWGFVAGWAAALWWLAAGMPDATLDTPIFPRDALRHLLSRVAPYGLAFVGLTVYSKVDVILLARWSGAVQVGYYSAAYKFVDVFQALVIVAAGAVYPRLARTAGAREGSTWGGGRAANVVILASLPAGLGLHLVAGSVVHLVFGAEYAGSAPPLRWLALLLPLLAVSVLGGYVLGAAGRMRPVASLYAAAVAVNVALNALLVPRLGAPGAALARLGSESLLVLGFLAVLSRIPGAAPSRRVGGAAVMVVAAAALAGALPDATGGWLRAGALLAAAAAIYRGSGVVDAATLGSALLGWRRYVGPTSDVERP